MFFTVLTFLTAFAIEGLGTLVSVIGLSTLFGANPIIIALAIALDAGKLVVVSLLYSCWKQLGVLMRSYALIAATVTMVITSAGAAGYLSGEFQKAIMGTQEGALKVEVLKGQIAKYEERKKQIDAQIAALPEKTTVNQRIRLINAFKAEQTDLQAKIAELDKQLPALQIAQIGVEAKAGPILYISKAFDIPVEEAVKWVILMIIFVFDPLAVFLIIAGNFLLDRHREKQKATADEAEAKFEEERLERRIVAAQEVFSPPFTPPAPMPPAPAPVVEDFISKPMTDRSSKVEVLPEASPVVAEAPAQDPSPPIFEVLQPTPVSPEARVVNYPDTSETRTYTRQDLIDEGVPDQGLIDAGYEPRAPEPAPEPLPAPAPEPVEPAAAQPSTLNELKPREVITREQLLAQQAHFPHVSSLNAVKADDTIVFTQNPSADSSEFYQNLK